MRDEAAAESSIGRLLIEAVGQVLDLSRPFPDFRRFLAWMQEEVPRTLVAGELDPAASRALATAMAYAIWNATPLPSRRYKPASVVPPGRNDPCPCGSGTKHKRCCGRAVELPRIDPEAILAIVLDRQPATEVERAFRDRLLPSWVAGRVARDRLDAEDAAGALILVESIFERPASELRRLDPRYHEALEALFDAYDVLAYDAEKRGALDRLARALRPPLRAEVFLRQAIVAATDHDIEAAQGLLDRAHRDHPDSPNLAPAEMAIYLGSGDLDRVRERARHWAEVFRRVEDAGEDGESDGAAGDDEGPVAFYERMAADPAREMLVSTLEPQADAEQIGRFLDVIHSASSNPIPRLELEPVDAAVNGAGTAEDGEAHFCVPRGSELLRRAWAAAWPLPDAPDDLDRIWEPDAATTWIAFLETRPQALDDLEILDDLLAAACVVPGEQWPVDVALTLPIAARGRAIIEHAVAAAAERFSARPRLPWRHPENRAALGILHQETMALYDADRDCMTPLRLLAALDPDDGYQAADMLDEIQWAMEDTVRGSDWLVPGLEGAIAQLKVTLRGNEPPIWRRLQMSYTEALWSLHVAIEDAMGWEHRHAHEFEVRSASGTGVVSIGISDQVDFDLGDKDVDAEAETGDDLDPETVAHGFDRLVLHEDSPLASWKVSIRDALTPSRPRLLYRGEWELDVVLESLVSFEQGKRYPRCVAGARVRPTQRRSASGHPSQDAPAARPEPARGEGCDAVANDDETFEPSKVRFSTPWQQWEKIFG